MKTLKFIVMALFAVVLSMNFAACSSSDGDDDGGQENQENQGNQGGSSNYVQKYITAQQSEYVNSRNENVKEQFNVSYNAENLLTEIDYRYYATNNKTFDETHANWKFNYDLFNISELVVNGGGTIGGMSNYSQHGNSWTFVRNEKGHIIAITQGKTDTYTFAYDENDHLVGSVRDYSGSKTTTVFTWQNDNLVEIKEESSGGYFRTYSFKYGNTANKWNIQPCRCWSIEPFNNYNTNIVMSSGLFGKLSKNLPTSISYNFIPAYESWIKSYTYEVDEQGYVRSATDSDGVCTTFSYKE